MKRLFTVLTAAVFGLSTIYAQTTRQSTSTTKQNTSRTGKSGKTNIKYQQNENAL